MYITKVLYFTKLILLKGIFFGIHMYYVDSLEKSNT